MPVGKKLFWALCKNYQLTFRPRKTLALFELQGQKAWPHIWAEGLGFFDGYAHVKNTHSLASYRCAHLSCTCMDSIIVRPCYMLDLQNPLGSLTSVFVCFCSSSSIFILILSIENEDIILRNNWDITQCTWKYVSKFLIISAYHEFRCAINVKSQVQ
jgi:hypothetical protein